MVGTLLGKKMKGVAKRMELENIYPGIFLCFISSSKPLGQTPFIIQVMIIFHTSTFITLIKILDQCLVWEPSLLVFGTK